MPLDAVNERGSLRFEIDKRNSLRNSAANVAKLRTLWLDRTRINDLAIGPGDPGDFDRGAWHVACHLLGAAGVCKAPDGRFRWLEVSHNSTRDRYFASVTWQNGRGTLSFPVDSAEGRQAMAGTEVLGFVEGNSTGRTSARNVTDSPFPFNLWRRQDFDQPVDSESDGGRVWEHWCTLRDIRETSELAMSVLSAFMALAATLGDHFAATVARGRSEYSHPVQLCAMIDAGLISEEAATIDIAPIPIPDIAEAAFAAADPGLALEACSLLEWTASPTYFMFKRRINSWVDAGRVEAELKRFRG
jgi:hypothetical protein